MKKSPNQSPPQEEDHPSSSSSSSSQTTLQKSPSFLLQENGDSIPPGEESETLIESPKRDSPIQIPTQFESPGLNGGIVDKQFESMFVDGRSPIGFREGSTEELNVENRMGGRMGKIMKVESGFVRREMMRRVEIGVRVSQMALCLVSFSVMAADRTAGWAGDYFDRYLEYRYCFSVNVIASAYSAFQVCVHIYYMIWKRCRLSHSLSYSFDFLLDQVLAYLLLSASSSAATRHDDWVSMFGSDKFTDMLIGSITTSFFAFLAFAFSSIISAYKLFGSNP